MKQNNLTRLIAAIPVMALLCACNNSGDPNMSVDPGERHTIIITNTQKGNLSKSNELAFDMWEKICENDQENDGNQFFSPLSVQMALSMLANGDDGILRDEIVALYAEGSTEEGIANLNNLNRILLDELPMVDKSTTIGIANSIWCDNSLSFTDGFRETCANFYDATSHSFKKQTEQARNDINGWCSEKSRGLIPEFLDTPPEEDLSIFNCAYFKGQWEFKFDKKNTSKKKFHCESGNAPKVDMMALDDYSLRGFKSDRMTFVSAPYGNGGFRMDIMMPANTEDFNECVALLKNPNFESKENITLSGLVKLKMPKFEVSASYELSDIISQYLPHLGKNLSNIINEYPIQASIIRQKTKCIVDENGTEAAAVTQITIVLGTDGSAQQFEVTLDHPFFFMIREESTGAILFMGKVAEF